MYVSKKIYIFFIISLLLCIESISKEFIVLQSTTSARDSGFYDFILPKFGKKFGLEVRVVAVGTGQAIKNSRRCDADVLIAHHKESEEKFIIDGYGLYRKEFMYNDFVLVGPKSDPAGVKKVKSIVGSLKKIKEKKNAFISRGDDSGTHKKEHSLWKLTGSTPNPKKNKWYYSVGQGMGGALNVAVNKEAYILSDRSTWESFKNKKEHTIVVENEPLLFNFYGVIPLNPKKCPDVKLDKAKLFVDWITSEKTKSLIATFRVNNKQLFFPVK